MDHVRDVNRRRSNPFLLRRAIPIASKIGWIVTQGKLPQKGPLLPHQVSEPSHKSDPAHIDPAWPLKSSHTAQGARLTSYLHIGHANRHMHKQTNQPPLNRNLRTPCPLSLHHMPASTNTFTPFVRKAHTRAHTHTQ
eukprot:425759-Prorocentrum_minimum.AAC.1